MRFQARTLQGQTFRSLGNRNYRLFFIGETVSFTGTWMQRVGQAWLVLELSGSGTMLGVTVALQALPLLVLTPFGGVLADRVDKRRLLLWTQAAAGILALGLGAVTAAGVVTMWMVLVLAVALGVAEALAAPAKHSLVPEMVDAGDVANAVTLNSIMRNAARALGPAAVGVSIAALGLATTFFLNGLSYFAVVVTLVLMRTGQLRRRPPVGRTPGQVREGLRYAGRTPAVAAPLALMVVSGTLAFESQVTLPLIASDVFDGGAQAYGLLFSAMGLGAVAGGLVMAGTLRPTMPMVLVTSVTFGGLVLATSASPTFTLMLVGLVAMGAASVAFTATTNSWLQLSAVPEMRGRVMSLWTMAIRGTTLLGGPLIGWIAETGGARLALAQGGAATILAALLAYWWFQRQQPATTTALPESSESPEPIVMPESGELPVPTVLPESGGQPEPEARPKPRGTGSVISG